MALVEEVSDINWSELFEINMSEEAIAQDCITCLQKSFGHSSFRAMQWKIVASILNDRRDNCVIMATGYGKSLCYQFPSVFLDTITIVVSPLISLMQDQVLGLRLNNLRACFLGSAQENRDTLYETIDRRYNIVYVTPEYITSEVGQFLLNKVQEYLTLIAIDEAHCISKWGHDFRSAYRNLSRLRDICPTVPILAMTATATPHVRDDIIQSLKLCNAQIISTGFDRPNLEFSIKHKTQVWADIGHRIASVKIGSVIVYCISRRVTEEVAATIMSNGHLCGVYHAGLSLTQRKKTHEDFIHDRIRVICATIAFGMGINKPDVRLVIHYGVAKDLESYYQEVGRAGRDGLPSQCMMFYENRDWTILGMIRNRTDKSGAASAHHEKLEQAMREYVSSNACRRRFILSYFGESCDNLKPRPNCCDNCKRQECKRNLFHRFEGLCEDGLLDITNESLKLLTLLRDCNGSFGLQKAILILRGSKAKNVPEQWSSHRLYGSLCDKTVKWLDAVGNILRNKGMMTTCPPRTKSNRNYPTCVISSKGMELLTTGGPLKIVPNDEFIRNLKIKVNSLPKILTAKPPDAQLSTSNGNLTVSSTTVPPKRENPALFDIYRPLLKVRTKLASLFDVMPYLVASTKALQQLATLQPTSMEDLKKIELDGYSEEKIERFGPVFIKVIRDFHAKLAKSVKTETSLAGNTIRRHLIVHDSSDQPSTSASNLALGAVKEEKCIPKLPASPTPHTTAIGIDCNQSIRQEESSVPPNSQDSVEVIESTPPPIIEISDSEGESKDPESGIRVSEFHEPPKPDTTAIEPSKPDSTAIGINFNQSLREEENAVPQPAIEISDSEEESESWQSGIRDSELLEIGNGLDEKSNQNSDSDIENEELDLLIAALRTERLYASQVNRRPENGDVKETVSSTCSRRDLPDVNQTEVDTLVSNTPTRSDSISISLGQTPTEVDSDPDIFAEFWDEDVNDLDLTQISEKVERQNSKTPTTAPPSSAQQNPLTNSPTMNSVNCKVKKEKEEHDIHLNDLDLTRTCQEPEHQIRAPAIIPPRPAERNSVANIPARNPVASSLNSVECKVKREKEESELDLLLNEIKVDFNSKDPQNGGTQATAMPARLTKAISNAFENGEVKKGEKEADLYLKSFDLTQSSLKTEKQITETPATIPRSPSERNPLNNIQSSNPPVSSSVHSAECEVKKDKEEKTELDLFLDEVILDLNLNNLPKGSQNEGKQATAMTARVIKKISNAFEYEDDSSSESDGERRPVTTPKKRALPSWMKLTNKRKR